MTLIINAKREFRFRVTYTIKVTRNFGTYFENFDKSDQSHIDSSHA